MYIQTVWMPVLLRQSRYKPKFLCLGFDAFWLF
jgi:hypothetical protein